MCLEGGFKVSPFILIDFIIVRLILQVISKSNFKPPGNFLQNKSPGGRIHSAIYKSYWEYTGKKSKQKVIMKLGYLDELEKLNPDSIAHFNNVAKQMTENLQGILIKMTGSFFDVKILKNTFKEIYRG